MVYKDKDNNKCIATNPNEIKRLVINKFKNWMSNSINDHTLPPMWQNPFAKLNLLSNIINNLQTSLTRIITIEEFNYNLKLCHSQSAPGPSLISYKILKLLSLKAKEHLIDTFNNIIKSGHAPIDWLESEIILLLKLKDWEGNISLTRSIILLEYIRKLFLKIIINRLYSNLNEFPILSLYNFTSLSGGNTVSPILTITNFIEHSKDNKEQMWLLFQNISEVFDSIDPFFLKLSLE